MKRNKLSTALALATAMGGLAGAAYAPSAGAISIAAQKLGDVDFPVLHGPVPQNELGIVEDCWQTLFNITNTSDQTLVVKLKFLEGYNSRDALTSRWCCRRTTCLPVTSTRAPTIPLRTLWHVSSRRTATPPAPCPTSRRRRVCRSASLATHRPTGITTPRLTTSCPRTTAPTRGMSSPSSRDTPCCYPARYYWQL